ncbi:MAG TPA: anti-sigma regulatory factor [Gemmatimonadales bacterium]
MSEPLRLPIAADVDVVEARQRGRALAADAGFSSAEQTVIAAAISEIARNIVMYAKQGEIILSLVQSGGRQGVAVVAIDEGPGIPDLKRAMQDGYSTGDGVGTGLPGAKRLMDEFEVESVVGRGTTVKMTKWRRAV